MPETFDFPELQYLILSNLSLSGAVPDISANKKLKWMILRYVGFAQPVSNNSLLMKWVMTSSNNKLTRFSNADFSVNPDLSDVIVSYNPISGAFPSSLLKLRYLYNLEI
ncbi:hypothetical protein HDU93_004234, partial [Gonapodya sp. JEL0774]